MNRQGPEHRGARRTIAVATYVLATALTVLVVVMLAVGGLLLLSDLWSWALS